MEDTGQAVGSPQNGSQSHIGPVHADDDRHMMHVCAVALEIQGERYEFQRRAGGITPDALQEYVGRYLDALQPLTAQDTHAQLQAFTARYVMVRTGRDAMSQEEFWCNMLLFCLRMAHDISMPIYNSADTLFELWLENAVTVGNEAAQRSIQAGRLRAETQP